MTDKVKKDDLLFHAVHGLCRVCEIKRASRTEEASYTLLPVTNNKAKVRFVVHETALENSGFGKPISEASGEAILEYLKTGESKAVTGNRAWKLAKLIWTEAWLKEPVKDARRRQEVNRAAKGLVCELALVLQMTVKEAAEIIQKNMGRPSEINPVVVMALAAAVQE